MRMTTVRLSEPLYRELQKLAERDGVSLAQWIRDAALAQLNFERGAEWERGKTSDLSEAPADAA
jgi:predicted DNA-binding ribbon-helix-helix protein